jgi:thioredoxin-related protein
MNVLRMIPVLLMIFSCASPLQDERPAPEIVWIGIEDGLEAGSTSDKKILVNMYTDWCNYCKKMTETVYPDSAVRQTVFEHFIAVGLNADSEALVTFKGRQIREKDLARELGVRSYPTLLFMSKDGNIILQSNGYMPAEDFNRMLLYIGSSAYETMEFIQFRPDKNTAKR